MRSYLSAVRGDPSRRPPTRPGRDHMATLAPVAIVDPISAVSPGWRVAALDYSPAAILYAFVAMAGRAVRFAGLTARRSIGDTTYETREAFERLAGSLPGIRSGPDGPTGRACRVARHGRRRGRGSRSEERTEVRTGARRWSDSGHRGTADAPEPRGSARRGGRLARSTRHTTEPTAAVTCQSGERAALSGGIRLLALRLESWSVRARSLMPDRL